MTVRRVTWRFQTGNPGPVANHKHEHVPTFNAILNVVTNKNTSHYQDVHQGKNEHRTPNEREKDTLDSYRFSVL